MHQQNLYIGFSPAHSKLSNKLAADFDLGMKAIRKSGQLTAILKKYGLSDWRK